MGPKSPLYGSKASRPGPYRADRWPLITSPRLASCVSRRSRILLSASYSQDHTTFLLE